MLPSVEDGAGEGHASTGFSAPLRAGGWEGRGTREDPALRVTEHAGGNADRWVSRGKVSHPQIWIFTPRAQGAIQAVRVGSGTLDFTRRFAFNLGNGKV